MGGAAQATYAGLLAWSMNWRNSGRPFPLVFGSRRSDCEGWFVSELPLSGVEASNLTVLNGDGGSVELGDFESSETLAVNAGLVA